MQESDGTAKRKRVTQRARVSSRGQTELSRDVEEDDDYVDNEYYDPDQDVEVRRKLRKRLRDLSRDLNDNRVEYLNPSSRGLIDTLNKANEVAKDLKQTSDATIDSRLLVTAADMSYRKTAQLSFGDSAEGVDVDDFIGKCIAFMRRGEGALPDGTGLQNPSVSEGHRRIQHINGDDIDGEEDDGDMLNWEHLGRFACFPSNSRPCLPGFLLGPLSSERRVRKITQRRTHLKATNLPQTQPQVLQAADIEKAENASLTVLCTRISRRLTKVSNDAMSAVEAEASEDATDAEVEALKAKHGIDSYGGVDFFRFVINPHSFGQSVENMFYVSFLLRDGKAGIKVNDDGMPFLGKKALYLRPRLVR